MFEYEFEFNKIFVRQLKRNSWLKFLMNKGDITSVEMKMVEMKMVEWIRVEIYSGIVRKNFSRVKENGKQQNS